MRQVGDMERLASKIAMQRINPREVNAIKLALTNIAEIKRLLNAETAKGVNVFMPLCEQLNPCSNVSERIAREINDDPPVMVQKCGVIRQGVSDELDDLRLLSTDSKDYLANMRENLVRQTGISSLKIGYTNVFGYYLEVRNTHKDKVPDDWTRKQTLTDAERYITPELKEYEEKILNAQDRMTEIEQQTFNALVAFLGQYIEIFQADAKLVAKIDCLASFAQVSIENHYCHPVINDSDYIKITEGRHPVIEKQLPVGEPYIPNDVFLDSENQQI